MSLPKGLIQAINGHYGEAGAEWLDRIPEFIEACQDSWSLRVLQPFPELTFHFVMRAVQAEGTEVVLKLGVPDREFRMQVEALRAFDGDGCVRLLDSEVDLGAMLLESLRPGDMLSHEIDDGRAVSVAAELMRRLWRSPPEGHSLPTLAEWTAALRRMRDRVGQTTDFLPDAVVERAADLLSELTEPQENQSCFTATYITTTSCQPSGSPGWRSTQREWSARPSSTSARSCATIS
ncbi:MAG: hypothetical protein O3A47_01885 [Chloroflexi bacterium]|nr:hypothetical protein [Chloroflexota bacterium]